MKNKSIIAFVFLLAGFSIGWFFSPKKDAPEQQVQGGMDEIRQGGFQYINPLLECELANSLEDKKLSSFKGDMDAKISELLKDKSVNHISLYYRDLANGPWFGVHEGEMFAPSSLLKVPVMFAYLKSAEKNPSLLNMPIEFHPTDIRSEKNTSPELQLKQGASYSVEELLRRMIQLSDNDSFNLLVANINSDMIAQVHNDLGIPLPREEELNFISVKSYASLFRVLYNSSYLSRPMSEMALEILSDTAFDQGMVAGVPESTVVAHKFGIRDISGQEEKQLHDCGIVYHANSPYLLCIMTRGSDMQKLADTISQLSGLVYRQVSNK